MTAPICPYCGKPALLVTGDTIYRNRPDLAHLKFWQCAPCDAYVGCHQTGKGRRPLGTLANYQLRMWRGNAHAVFDPFWRNKRGDMRNIAYENLASELGIQKQDCHIGMFDIETCKRVIQICAKWRATTRR